MDAFKDKSIKAIFPLTGGDDTIRLLPFIDYKIIRENPKIFMGFSDTTANHFMLNKVGVISFYGPAVAVEFSACNNINEQSMKTVKETLFENKGQRQLIHSGEIANDPVERTNNWVLKYEKDPIIGYQIIQGKGKIIGELLGGCLELFVMMSGTEIFPKTEGWKGKILFIETSEDKMSVDLFKRIFYNLGAQGIINVINGIIIGRPKDGVYYVEYNEVIKEVTRIFGRNDLPVMANAQFGHAWQWNILPLGCKAEIDCDKETLTLMENCVE